MLQRSIVIALDPPPCLTGRNQYCLDEEGRARVRDSIEKGEAQGELGERERASGRQGKPVQKYILLSLYSSENKSINLRKYVMKNPSSLGYILVLKPILFRFVRKDGGNINPEVGYNLKVIAFACNYDYYDRPLVRTKDLSERKPDSVKERERERQDPSKSNRGGKVQQNQMNSGRNVS
ncbi:hypothetical protein C0J52_22391 [Blattella germanica]|nr:hypothetical protein C0J52_22391 [Blattella germanica]